MNFLTSCRLTVILLFSLSAVAPAAVPPKNDHVIVMVFDQMRADYIDRYDLKNFKRLQKLGTNYPSAWVGHLAAATVVSHLVIQTGLLPKDLPWNDDVMEDTAGTIGPKNTLYASTYLNLEQLTAELKSLPKSSSLTQFLQRTLNKKVVAVGEKDYATILMGGTPADRVITMKKTEGHCSPTGVNVPSYITTNPRFTLECAEAYGTEKSFYPLDGLHFYPGTDSEKLGGDVWTADAALEVMNHEDWGGLFLTFGAIDKFGHMMGEDDIQLPLPFKSPANLADILRVADQQLGRILDRLNEKKLLEHTLIIATADHGGQTDSIYLGNGSSQAFGPLKNHQSLDPLPFWLARLEKNVKIKMGYADTSIRIWLSELTPANRQNAIAHLREIPQVTRVFELVESKNGFTYRDVYSNLRAQPSAFQKWALKHDQPLLDSMASTLAPHYVALLADQAGFGKIGDHGGNQEHVQRIPMIIQGAGFKAHASNKKELRLVDISAVIHEALDPKAL